MKRQPIIHCITNYVAMNFTANAILAVGARPLMSFCPDEMDEIVAGSDALLVNIGCLDHQQIEAMKLAVEAAARYGRPWVLDPVGAQFTKLRHDTCRQLIGINPPAIIKGNTSEIAALSGTIQGLDSVVVTTGPTDIIAHQSRRAEVSLGDPIMTRVTAMGCAAGGILAAAAATASDPFEAAVNAMTLIGKAGQAAARHSKGTASFKNEFIDELYRQSTTIISGH